MAPAAPISTGSGTIRTDTEALRKAEERFRALTGAGFTAARRKDGQAQLVRSFDPSADETLFFPRLQGG
jgi:hypothetical protein